MKKFFNWLKNLFKTDDPQYPTPIPPVVNPKPEPEPTKPSTKQLTIHLCLGHSATGADKGASGIDPKTGKLWSEVEYNTKVMNYIVANVKNHKVRAFFGSSSLNAVNQSNSAGVPDINLQLHCNAYLGTKANNYTSSAKGCEALVLEGHTNSYPLGQRFVAEFTAKFKNVPARRTATKGLKILNGSDRGIASVKASKAKIKVLLEPFFIDNRENFVQWEDYAKFMVYLIDSL